jgi:DNA repair exonuclease SbcCD nuclease subunit
MAMAHMKICHLADLHLGYRAFHRTAQSGVNQREYDVAVAFKEVVDKLIEIQPDAVLVAGDFFHSVRPANSVINFAFREMQRLHEGIGKRPIIVIAGNHESPRSRDTGCVLELFHRIDGGAAIKVAYNEPRSIACNGGLQVLCVPHNAVLQRPKLEPYRDMKYNVLLIHAASNEYVPQARHGGQILRAEEIKPDEWDYVALGDYHSHTVIAPNMIYPGSIERTSTNIWAEADEPKGFVIYDLARGEHEFVELADLRPVFDLGPFHGTGMTASDLDDFIEQELSQIPIDGAIVRIKILDVPRSVAREMDRKKLGEWRSRALHLHPDIRPPAAVSRGPLVGPTGERRTLVEEFAAFIEDRFGDDRSKEVIELGRRYLDQAEEQDKEEV